MIRNISSEPFVSLVPRPHTRPELLEILWLQGLVASTLNNRDQARATIKPS